MISVLIVVSTPFSNKYYELHTTRARKKRTRRLHRRRATKKMACTAVNFFPGTISPLPLSAANLILILFLQVLPDT